MDRIRSFMIKNNLQVIIRSHECVMDGVENLENTELWTVFSCTEYGGKYQNDASVILVRKNNEIVSNTIEMIKGNTQWAQMVAKNQIFQTATIDEENDLRNRPVTPPRNARR